MAGGARVCLGQIGAPHGVRGEVRLRSFTSDPQAITDYGALETEDGRPLQIQSLRAAKDHFVAVVSGVRDRAAARQLTNMKLYIPRERLPQLEEADEYYHTDLIGLSAVDRAGKRIGTVIAIHNFGAGDLLEVRAANGKSELLSFDAATVPEIDVAAGRLVVDQPPTAAQLAPPSKARSTLPLKRRHN